MLFRLPYILQLPEGTDTTSVGSAVDKAMADHGDTPEFDDDGNLVTTTETKIEDKKDDDDSADKTVDPTEVEKAQALELWNSLKDPEKAPAIIEFIAKQAGYTKAELKEASKTKEGAAEVKDDIQEILRESLGKDLEAVADRLAVAIGKILDKKIPEATKDLREKESLRESAVHEAAAQSETDKISTEYFGGKGIPADVEKAMTELMDEMPPSSTISADKYVRKIFNSVAGERGLTKQTQTQQQTRNKNQGDAVSRLASKPNASGHVPDKSGAGSASTKSLSQIVDDAMEEVAKS
jgi:hypothetical protein